MEPSWSPVVATGRNRPQIRSARKPRKQAKIVATGCDQLPKAFHGKEGVDGSSPSEGLPKSPANWHLLLPAMARFRYFAGTRRVHFGTGGHWRALAGTRDVSRHGPKRARDTPSRPLTRKFLQTGSPLGCSPGVGEAGAAGRIGVHSCWSACSTLRREARLAGRMAASIPARIATTTKAASDPYGIANTIP